MPPQTIVISVLASHKTMLYSGRFALSCIIHGELFIESSHINKVIFDLQYIILKHFLYTKIVKVHIILFWTFSYSTSSYTYNLKSKTVFILCQTIQYLVLQYLCPILSFCKHNRDVIFVR